MKTINWGIIGAGNISTRFSKVLAGESHMAVRAVYNRHIGRAEVLAGNFPGCRAFSSLEELLNLEGLDAVYIGLTNDMHLPAALQCMKAGKAVLCEKPMALSADEAEVMIACARENGVLLMEAMWTRFLPAYQKAKQWVGEGRIGRGRMIEASFCFRFPFDPQHRLYRKEMGGGGLYDVGVYCLEAITGILGRPDDISSAVHLCEPGVDDLAVVSLIYRDGAVGTAASSIAAAAPAQMSIYGEKGSIQLPPDFFRADKALLYDEEGALIEAFEDRFDDGFVYQIRHFAGLLREDRTESEIMPLSDTLDCARIFDAVLRGEVGKHSLWFHPPAAEG